MSDKRKRPSTDSLIRRFGVVMLVAYGLVFAQLNVLHLVRADEYSSDPTNRRAIRRDFEQPRGVIQTRDGVVLAESVDTPDEAFERRRTYTDGPVWAHVVGHFSFTFGTEGIEREYNDALAGRTPELSVRDLDDLFTDRHPVGNVTLTLTEAVQRAAFDALDGRRGAVVALDPRTGAVLALVSSPSYDPAQMAQFDQAAVRTTREALLDDPADPLVNRATRERYFPGSTFKIVTATAGLATGEVTRDTPSYPVLSALALPTTNRPLRNFGGSSCGGTLLSIIRVSCNTAFGQMGLDVGPEALAEAAAAHGFGEVPPLDLPAVVAASFPALEAFDRNIPAVAQAAIGQFDVQATPLQMALVAAAVANGGSIMAPHVVAEIRDDRGDVIDTTAARQWRRALTTEHAAVLAEAMVGVVDSGTATRLRVPGIEVGAKTGTAELGGDSPASHAWIIAFAPRENPRVALAVFVEGDETTGSQTGGRVAAPIAKAVLDAVLATPDTTAGV